MWCSITHNQLTVCLMLVIATVFVDFHYIFHYISIINQNLTNRFIAPVPIKRHLYQHVLSNTSLTPNAFITRCVSKCFRCEWDVTKMCKYGQYIWRGGAIYPRGAYWGPWDFSQSFYELIIQILTNWFYSELKNNYSIMSQFRTCHKSSAVVTYSGVPNGRTYRNKWTLDRICRKTNSR